MDRNIKKRRRYRKVKGKHYQSHVFLSVVKHAMLPVLVKILTNRIFVEANIKKCLNFFSFVIGPLALCKLIFLRIYWF